ncbi:hypothetical protein P8452_34926 [Trifolium repens]|nr:hypothetical protein P8452_34926 [Trifolium repens]
MEVLKDRCLISISEGRIVMHDLVQEMGHEIVRQQCVNDTGKRSRLWKPEDIYDVLGKNKGTDAIQCIFLDISKIRKVQLHPETFEKMHNLRMIQFYSPSSSSCHSNVTLPAFLKSLPDDLIFLRWDGFPQRSFPLNFCPEYLVKLDMPHSHLEQLWEGNQVLPNLKRINLSNSRKLRQLPDLCLSPNIEEIILTYCSNLVKVYSSRFINNLNYLCLHGCVKLRSLNLPSNILSGSPGLVLLYGCYKLETFLISNRTKVVQPSGSSHCHGFKEVSEISWAKIRGDVPTKVLSGDCNSREYSSATFDPIFSTADKYEENHVDNRYLREIKMEIQTMPSLFTSINELCWLDMTDCESLTSIPGEIFKLKFLTRFYLGGCFNLKKLPEIEETMENLLLLVLDKTAIRELPSSLDHLVGLENLSLQMCVKLVIIPPSIGNLSKLSKLNLTYCESLETFPSSIFKLKLTKLDLHGCSMLKTFPEILEPSETFSHINLTKTAIKELPSSLKYLVGLRNLCLNLCCDLMSLPNSIVNLKQLSHLDCSGCKSLTEIPKNIGFMPSLKELSLQKSSIVNLPESIVHLSSLKSLDLSDCKRLECIPQLPPYINQLLTFDCPSIKRMMSNSISTGLNLNLPSDSNETSSTFKFHFTNSEQLDASARRNIAAEALLRITKVEYRSVFFCFPGNAIPRWFPYRRQGHSVTAKKTSLDWCSSNNRLVGFALCVVLGHVDDYARPTGCSITYTLTFEFDGRTHTLPIPNDDMIKNYFHWKGARHAVQNHTFIWKYQLDFQSISDNNMLFHADNFTLKLSKYNHRSDVVKGCGLCPLYINEKDHNGVQFLNNDIEEPSGSNAS